jgi:hypothetical protein
MRITLTKATTGTEGPTDASPRTARSRWTRRAAAAATVAIGVAASGVAVAAWNVTGSGEGTAAAASAVELEIVSFGPDTSLYPGLTTSATLTVSNPNPFPVNLTDVKFGTLEVDSEDGCSADNSEVVFADVSEAEFFLAAGAESVEIVLENVVTMGTGAADACQGVTFTAAIDLTAESTTAP